MLTTLAILAVLWSALGSVIVLTSLVTGSLNIDNIDLVKFILVVCLPGVFGFAYLQRGFW